jgi:hypothetical protein
MWKAAVSNNVLNVSTLRESCQELQCSREKADVLKYRLHHHINNDFMTVKGI